ncbi:MAG TPA: DUF721 domain-containing protein [Acidobacteriota bacterium]|nr:DUF721 domain-containing protein [Acidobacteriota bacterium]HNB70352.1 DUF721 domain-containing protein [Acidobacteriota bacterium]HND17906.1 DUF721 domain-containing protein [Acidobacteriota bacterium]HNG95590.1 DUF721 domain-containing protein [Acidobacteriota bacterium]HNH82714.1 DUF721 domain-containing protein [Acidobacteriota bacterium]
MESMSRLLPLMIKAAGPNEEILESACFAAWDLAVGQATSRISAPVSLSGKLLTVATLDQRWKKQLEALTDQVLFRLNSTLGQPLVARIQVVVDSAWVEEKRRSLPTLLPPQPLPPPDPDLLDVANTIEDPKLRDQYLRTATRYLNHPSRDSKR